MAGVAVRVVIMTKYQIWYMKPEWFRDGLVGKLPDATNLSATHVHLKDLEIDGTLDGVFRAMQGEIWSPNGEARGLILSKGLQHTSMSVGDVIIDGSGQAHVVASFGFKPLEGRPTAPHFDCGIFRDGACMDHVLSEFPECEES
jgi:hypothetical protein